MQISITRVLHINIRFQHFRVLNLVIDEFRFISIKTYFLQSALVLFNIPTFGIAHTWHQDVVHFEVL